MTAILEEFFDDSADEDSLDLKFSKREYIVKELTKRNLIGYGAVIAESIIEEIVGRKKSKVSYEKWAFLMLTVREIIKTEGFYVSSRGRNGDLYILQPHEMPAYNDRKTKVMFKNLRMRQKALHMIDETILSNEQKKKLEFEILKNSRIELELASLSKQRCRYD